MSGFLLVLTQCVKHYVLHLVMEDKRKKPFNVRVSLTVANMLKELADSRITSKSQYFDSLIRSEYAKLKGDKTNDTK